MTATTATRTRKTARKPLTEEQKAARNEARKARIAAMEAAVEEFELDEDDARTMRAFESLTTHYSEGNATLILAQAAQLGLKVRGLADVGGYGAFQERGRQVRKGEHQSLFVWARVERKNTDETETVKVVEETVDGKKVRAIYVPQGLFHSSQTDAK